MSTGLERTRAVKNISHISLLNSVSEEHTLSSFLLIQQNRRITAVCYSSHGHLPFLSNSKTGEDWDCSTWAAEQEIPRFKQSQHFYSHKKYFCLPKSTVEISRQDHTNKVMQLGSLFQRQKASHHNLQYSTGHTHTCRHSPCNASFMDSASSAPALQLESRTRGFKDRFCILHTHTQRNNKGMAQK